MSSYIRLIGGGVFSAVFILCVIIFAAQFAIDNETDVSISDDPRFINLQSDLEDNLSQVQSDSQSSQEFLFSSTLESGDENSLTGAQFKVGPLTAVSLAVTSLNTAFFTIAGVEFSFIQVAIVSMLTFMIGYFTIKAWLGREPN